ncbi:hypothetical protein [Psychrobacillus phage Spoks]|nr:hypothetical protein [Psychrobacillus phage Spoks]
MMKVNDMDKYQLTEAMKSVIMYLVDPNVTHDIPEKYYKELIDLPTDEDGYVHKYYFTDEAKVLIEILVDNIKRTNYFESRFILVTIISIHIMISVEGGEYISMEDRAEDILHNEKIKLILGVIEAQHKRLLDEINSGVNQQGFDVEIRMGLKTFESNYEELFKLKNEK